ncbi:sugar-binding transcriptional regulator [Siculibacillus lacustris]|uniref:Sugar-binding transcriptional regulator n=2 Tax=Siculibacillus lacustris TaxID=1549641 RepID=A0A4Q9VQ87_9HYPH|nr:sugar-binding transcriptional regulator [Siculibacillus lacustris]
MVRAAWLYYVGGLNQEETAARLGLHRSRVNRLLSEARDKGLVSITIQSDLVRLLEVEHRLEAQFGLDFCVTTPPIGFERIGRRRETTALQAAVARRAVGAAAAHFLKGKLEKGPATIGVGWGRTLEQMAMQLTGVRNPEARFVSLMGSLDRNLASNSFEVIQLLAGRVGGQGHFLALPFVADTESDRDVFMSQRTVAGTLAVARAADLHMIGVGELAADAFLTERGMLSKEDLASLHAAGAVADTLGHFFDADGGEIDHPLSRRTLAIGLADLRETPVVLIAGGICKVRAITALLRSGVVDGLVIDGDTALELDEFSRASNGRR